MGNPRDHNRQSLSIVKKYHPEVTQIVDALRPIDIEVTQNDCENGRSKSPSACAMAKAFLREFDGAVISLSRAYLIKGKKATRYIIPPFVAREIVVFDRVKQFKPGKYSLCIPHQSAKLGPRQYPQSDAKKKQTENSRKRMHTQNVRAL